MEVPELCKTQHIRWEMSPGRFANIDIPEDITLSEIAGILEHLQTWEDIILCASTGQSHRAKTPAPRTVLAKRGVSRPRPGLVYCEDQA